MKMTLEFDPTVHKEIVDAHALLTILGGEFAVEEIEGTVSNITKTPEDRKDPAAEKAATDKAAADKAAATKAAADKNKADAAAAAKTKADAEAKAKADAEAAAEAEAKAKAEADSDDFLDGPADETVYTIEDVRGALKLYSAKHNKEKAIQILKDNGASTIGELSVEKYGLVMAQAKVDD